MTETGDQWNGNFWHQIDGRLRHWLSLVRGGQDGDEEAEAEVADCIRIALASDEDTYGAFEAPSRDARCEMQQEYAAIFANGLESNV
ncbi:unnamed protein product [Tilletia controversa]|nr:unnamed protein product [Tilletia controversa]